MANTISVSVLADVKDISRKLGSVEGQLSGFGKKMSGLGKLVGGAFAAVGALQVFKDVVQGASDAQQSLGATETVFGKFAGTVVKTSNEAATKFGLSANEYRENANLLGAVLGNLGVKQSDLAGKTQSLISTGADLAATYGGTTKSAVEALTAAYKGEFEQLERYGVSIKAADVSTRLAAKGQDKLKGAALKTATQIAIGELIAKQSAKSNGAFARETDTLAHQQQVLAAKVQNTKDKIGGALLPVLTGIASFISDTALPKFEQFTNWFATQAWPKIQPFVTALKDNLLKGLQNLGTFLTGTLIPGLQTFVGWLQQNSAWLMPIVVGIGAMLAAYKAYTTYLAIVSAVTKAYAAVQVALNVIMSANPIGLLVLAVVGLVAALIYAWKNSETFRNVVIKVWNAVKNAAVTVWNFVVGFLKGAFNTIKGAISTYFNFYKSVITGAWNIIKSVTSAVWNGIKGFVSSGVSAIKGFVSTGLNTIKSIWSNIWNGIKTVISTIWKGIKAGLSGDIGGITKIIGTIKGKVLSVLSGAGSWLLSTGRNIIAGLINGVGQMAGRVLNKVREVIGGAVDFAKQLLGIASPSRVFRDIGKFTGQGLVKGLDSMGSKIRKAAGNMTAEVETGFSAPRLTLNAATASGSASVGTTYNINVTAIDPQSASRAVVDSIREYERMNGRLY